jgi:hypothetical protein
VTASLTSRGFGVVGKKATLVSDLSGGIFFSSEEKPVLEPARTYGGKRHAVLCLRGMASACWQSRRRRTGISEIIDTRICELLLPTFESLLPQARLGLARAYALQRDTSNARTAYQDFFAYWKDADPDIPILQQAKAEYAKLHL